MKPLYSIAEVIAATGGEARDVASRDIGSISIDSRDIEPGALFVAIRGAAFDGHDFVAKAVEAGAVAALVTKDRAAGLAGLPLIVADDALEGLYGLARFNRARSRARIVAVTGSVGKTSTKEAIRIALEGSGITHASIKSFNNHWGVPLMLARMPADTAFAVFEIGMSSAGEIAPLSRLVRPHAAVITTVAPAHLEFFASEAAIADAKAEIFEGLEPAGIAILGHDHRYLDRLRQGAWEAGHRVLTYGYDPAADIRIENYRPLGGGAVAELAGDESGAISVAAPGRHMLANAVAALVAARALGADTDAALSALREHGAPEGRGAAFVLGDPDKPLRLIDESYNANPLSMRAALEVFPQLAGQTGRRILVLGDMRELGAAADIYHAQLRDAVLAAGPDLVFLVGPHMEKLAAVLPPRLVARRSQTVDDIAEPLLQTLAPGDSVMVKGSNGLRLGTLVARIRAHYRAPN